MELETIEVAGTPREMGRAYGEAKREAIQRFVDMRFAAVAGYFKDRGRPNDWPQVTEVGAKGFELYKAWDPEGYEEQFGVAEGADIDPVRLFTICNMTDMRDAVLLSAPSGPPLKKLVDEGCTSLMVPESLTSGGAAFAAQTWDLNPPDVEFVVAVHRKPNEGPRTWGVTCNGCLTLMGINEEGVSVGTTNIKTYGSGAGVGYLSILHRGVRATSSEEAEELMSNAPHAGAHTYWIGAPGRLIELEASPNGVVRRDAIDAPIWRTNHCISEQHVELQGEVVGESSVRRFARVGEMLGGRTDLDVDAIKAVFADRSQGIYSVNRYEEDGQGTATNAVFISLPEERRAFACRGPADRGTWVELSFD